MNLAKKIKNLKVNRLFIILCFFFVSEFAIHAQSNEIENNYLHLKISSNNGYLENLTYREDSTQGNYSKSKVFSAPFNEMFRLYFNGIDLSGLEWKKEDKSTSSLSASLYLQDRGLRIIQSWKLLQNKPIFEYKLEIVSNNSILENPSAIRIFAANGIGENPPDDRSGIGSSDYYFTDPVYSINGKVTSNRLIDNESVLLKKSESDINFIGLHSRYYSFILTPKNNSLKSEEYLFQPPSFPKFNLEKDKNLETLFQINIPIPANSTNQTYSWNIYVGSKKQEVLSLNDPDLSSILYHKNWFWMRWLILAISFILYTLESIIGNWAISILILAVIVRLFLHPISKKVMKSQKKFNALQSKIQPEIKEIKKSFKGADQSEKILEVYKKYNVSPLAGLKPLLIVLIQLPIFVSLYHLLGQAYELQFAGFLWIESLAKPDHFFKLPFVLPYFGEYFNLLPLIMSGTTLISMKINPAPTADESSTGQNLLLILMTIGFFLLFYSFPSGMVLYWTMANILHFLYGLIYR